MSDCHKEFLESYRDYPCQDNEGYTPDRAGFKTGFCEAWRIQEELNSGLILKKLVAEKDARIKQLEEAIDEAIFELMGQDDQEAIRGALEALDKALGEDKE